MNELYKDKLEILRQRIPIGLRHALALLEKFEGDLDKSEKQFHDEMVALIITKTGVTAEVATKHLMTHRFDIALTIKGIDEERYTLTELILRKFKNKKEDALGSIAYTIEQKHSLKKNFWLVFDNLKTLPPELYCFLTIIEWLNYESWEDYQSALSFHLDIVTEQLETKLGLADLANSLRKAEHIWTVSYEENGAGKDIQKYIDTSNELQNNNEYRKCKDDFVIQRPVVIERLYDLVRNNIDKFP